MAWHSYLRRLHQERKPVPEWRTSHGSRSENSLKPLRKRSQMVTTYSKHKNEPFEGRNMQERQRNRRRRSMRATILAIWRTRVCDFVFRVVFIGPQVFKTKDANDSEGLGYGLLVPAGLWSMCWSLCPYESVTPNACSCRSLLSDERNTTWQHRNN